MSADKCKSADKYQGKRPPKCNGGHPCAACRARRYAALQDQRARLMRQYRDLELEIVDIDGQLAELER